MFSTEELRIKLSHFCLTTHGQNHHHSIKNTLPHRHRALSSNMWLSSDRSGYRSWGVKEELLLWWGVVWLLCATTLSLPQIHVHNYRHLSICSFKANPLPTTPIIFINILPHDVYLAQIICVNVAPLDLAVNSSIVFLSSWLPIKATTGHPTTPAIIPASKHDPLPHTRYREEFLHTPSLGGSTGL